MGSFGGLRSPRMLGGSVGTTLLGREDDDCLALIQCGEQALHREVDPCALDPAVCQGPQKHRSRPRATVDVERVVGPRIPWPPPADVASWPCLQDVLKRARTPVRSNHLVLIPWVSVCDDHVFAHRGRRSVLDDVRITGLCSLQHILGIAVDRLGKKTWPVRLAPHRLTLLV